MSVEENNSEYESDPEETKMSLNVRRRVCSDDELEDDGVDRVVNNAVNSDVISDGEGGAADDYVQSEEDDVYYSEFDDEEVEVVVKEREIVGGEVEKTAEVGGEVVDAVVEAEKTVEDESEAKAVEPFAVPTSGAFYMHDDRFRGNAGGRGGGGRQRPAFGGKKLWESKDERKWGHDKFEELRHYEQERSSKGSYQGRGKPRGGGRGHGRSRVNGNSENMNAAPKDVRGRGRSRYQPLLKNKGETHPPQYKKSGRSFDRSLHSGSRRTAVSTGSTNVEHEAAPAKKVGSNLSYTSPPFYPSGASSKDIALTQKKELHTRDHTRNIRSNVDPNVSRSVSNPMLRGENVIGSTGIKNLHIDDTVSPISTKAISSSNLRSPASSSSSPNQLAHARGHGRIAAPRPDVFQPPQTNNQLNKVSPRATKGSQRSTVQTHGQSPLQAPGQQLAWRPVVAPKNSPPPKAGIGAVQGTGKGSLVYGDAQVMGSGGNIGAGHVDPNVPAFYPVMQFAGQHQGGMGVPAVGMAFPGYVAQPNGLGKSEMTWLPMLASAAGALGATYCPPYIPVDGNYHPRPPGQTSALPAPSKDNNLSKPNNEIKTHQRSEGTHQESSQKQYKPRRYSEMNFSQ